MKLIFCSFEIVKNATLCKGLINSEKYYPLIRQKKNSEKKTPLVTKSN